ncbi:HNH endonuclease [Priestia megaterium]|uniref:HNH endonuclease n=1 Tax=Priestia megaterium TaxID=1404 RepID=UPI002E242D7C|nr:HNH endonuclease [Priestia megaterium]MED4755677.1 HNH endonuclease [Priestia megaterium]
MAKVKHENLALTSAFNVASLATYNFYEGYDGNFLYEYEDEIIETLIKPQKTTALHYFLACFVNVAEEVHDMLQNIDEIKYVYDYIKRVLEEVNLDPKILEPDFENCADEYHEDCGCKLILDKWVEYVKENNDLIHEALVHAAFQIVFLDRKFLHDFNEYIGEWIEYDYDSLKEKCGEHLLGEKGFKRVRFPQWLKDAVYHRDKGCCVICRTDLSKLVNINGTHHIDHIVPLRMFGSNDSSNFQLLCETCNTSKGNRTSETNSINVPFWNMD